MIFPPGTLEAFGLYLARSSALVIASPILGIGSRFSGYKIGLIFALALVLYLATGEPLGEYEAIAFGAMALREILIGLFLAFSMHLVILAVRVAGELIGHEMGFMIARQVDPATGVRTPVITSLYETLFILALLSMNGHHWLIRALGSSFERAPVGRLDVGAGFAPMTVRLFGEMFEAGIVFAAPVMALLFLVSLLIGLLARAVPHLNVLEVGFSLRVSVSLMAMLLFAPLLQPAMEQLQRTFEAWLEHAVDSIALTPR
ncbi:MAG: flagellar biosynthetic protein FliR [Planctomycetota bacterium]|nr:flagellar biosynthetic protein FliR [Planctomycetota bacterium]